MERKGSDPRDDSIEPVDNKKRKFAQTGNPRRLAAIYDPFPGELLFSAVARKSSQPPTTRRKGKVLIDWSQNDDKKTTVNVYSLRAKDRPTVSTPVTWDEVEKTARHGRKLSFEAADVVERAEKLDDLFEPVLKLKQKLPPLLALKK